MIYYFILNGPPKAGKSTLAGVALRHFKVRQIQTEREELAKPIKQFMSALLGKPYSSIDKSLKVSYLSCTSREALISLSEDHMKRRYGHAVFGNALRDRWSKADSSAIPTVLVIDDCGFQEEFDTLPRDRTYLIRLIRPGYNFNSDSRNYVPKQDRTLVNDGELRRAESIIQDMVDDAIERWKLK